MKNVRGAILLHQAHDDYFDGCTGRICETRQKTRNTTRKPLRVTSEENTSW